MVATVSAGLCAAVERALPDVEVFVSELEWLGGSAVSGDDTEISRLLLVDREAILVSSAVESGSGQTKYEQAVFGRGFDNGLVTIVRRLMATGLLDGNDPGTDES